MPSCNSGHNQKGGPIKGAQYASRHGRATRSHRNQWKSCLPYSSGDGRRTTHGAAARLAAEGQSDRIRGHRPDEIADLVDQAAARKSRFAASQSLQAPETYGHLPSISPTELEMSRVVYHSQVPSRAKNEDSSIFGGYAPTESDSFFRGYEPRW